MRANGPTDPPVQLEVANLPHAFRMRGHGHAASHLCVLLSGGLSEQHQGRSRDWGGSWIRVSGPGTEHDLRVLGPSARCLVIEFPSPLLPRAWDRAGSTFIEAPGLARMLRRELAPYAADRPFGPLTPADSLAVECRLSELLARLVRTQKLRRETPVPCWLARSRERLHAEAETPPSLTDLARQAGVHPSHLARAFRDHYGRTIGSYVRLERLRLACTRLTESGESLSDIAAQAGFADQAHFTRTFVARWGISPGRYRQCLRGAPALGIERMELGPKGIPRTEREPIDAGPGNFEPMQIPFKTLRD